MHNIIQKYSKTGSKEQEVKKHITPCFTTEYAATKPTQVACSCQLRVLESKQAGGPGNFKYRVYDFPLQYMPPPLDTTQYQWAISKTMRTQEKTSSSGQRSRKEVSKHEKKNVKKIFFFIFFILSHPTPKQSCGGGNGGGWSLKFKGKGRLVPPLTAIPRERGKQYLLYFSFLPHSGPNAEKMKLSALARRMQQKSKRTRKYQGDHRKEAAQESKLLKPL